MSLKQKVMEQLKAAMKRKDKVALESLRAIKSELLLLETGGGDVTVTQAQELQLLQRLIKQRKDSAAMYQEQGRADLAEQELAQAAIIMQFLPAQMSQEEVAEQVKLLIDKLGAKSMADMGKVMGVATKELAGKTDGKTISTIVKQLLMNQ